MYKMKSFYDSHLHFVGIGLNELEFVNVSECNSHKSVSDTLSSNLERDMIIARGWHQENFLEKRSFTKELLNQISTEIPIVCIRTCGHVLVCNDKMMEMAGVTNSSLPVEGGTFSFETGVFTENALAIIYKDIPKPTKERIKEEKQMNQNHMANIVNTFSKFKISFLGNEITRRVNADNNPPNPILLVEEKNIFNLRSLLINPPLTLTEKNKVDMNIKKWKVRLENLYENKRVPQIMKFKKSEREILTVVHNHMLSLSVIFFLLSLILAVTSINKKLKYFLMIEPFLSIVLTFGGIYFLWKGITWFKYIVILSGSLMSFSFIVATTSILYQLLFHQKVKK